MNTDRQLRGPPLNKMAPLFAVGIGQNQLCSCGHNPKNFVAKECPMLPPPSPALPEPFFLSISLPTDEDLRCYWTESSAFLTTFFPAGVKMQSKMAQKSLQFQYKIRYTLQDSTLRRKFANSRCDRQQNMHTQQDLITSVAGILLVVQKPMFSGSDVICAKANIATIVARVRRSNCIFKCLSSCSCLLLWP